MVSEGSEHPLIYEVHGTVSVLVVDDDALARQGLIGTLGECAHLTVVGQAHDGEEVVAAVEAGQPDVVLMDVEMPHVDGVRATWRLSAWRPDLAVVLMTAAPSDELVFLALRAGAAGVVSKGLSAQALDRVLCGAAEDEGAISRRTCRTLSEELHRLRLSTREMRPIDGPLTTREWQILHLMERGVTTGAMSRQLLLSVHTVRTHVKRILAKLDVHSRAEAVAWAEHRPSLPTGQASPDHLEEERDFAAALEEVLQNNFQRSQVPSGAADEGTDD